MSANGQSAEEVLQKKRELKREERREQDDSQREQYALQDAFNADGQLSRGFVESLVSKEDLEIGAPEAAQEQDDVIASATVAKLQNMLSRDWVLGNLTEAQEHDARHKAEVIKLKIEDMHPPAESHMQGKVRRYMKGGGPDEELTSLSAQERLLIDELVETLKVRFGRGRGGFEREQQNTSISRAETDRQEADTEESRWGLF